MGAALTRCTCLEGWLLADPTIYEKLNNFVAGLIGRLNIFK